MNKLVTLSILILFGSTANCQSKNDSLANVKEKILEINYDAGGGRFTDNTILKISKDSTFYNAQKDYHPKEGRYSIYISKSIKTDAKFWEDLIASINLTDFDKAQNGPNNREIDGYDVFISIATSTKWGLKKHYHIIGNNDKELDNFFKKIYTELKQFE